MIGLTTLHPGQAPQELTPALRARILAKTQEPPPDGSTHWSLRKMAAVIGVSKELIRKVWKEADLRPHRLERYLASNHPQFEEKAEAMIGLYMHPPQHAAVFCVDEKSAFRPWIARIAACRYRRGAPNGMDSNIIGTELGRCLQR